MAPAEKPGFIKISLSDSNKEDYGISIDIKNYGINPISKLIANLYFVTLELKEKDEDYNNAKYFERRLVSPFQEFHCINPLPGGTSFHLDIPNKQLKENPWVTSAGVSFEGVILTVEYSDSILRKDKIPPSVFYWNQSDSGQLLEVDDKTYKSYRELMKNRDLIN
ncbi:MAG: hypothetical protein PVF17_02080 [Ignavibacteria bacterium]